MFLLYYCSYSFWSNIKKYISTCISTTSIQFYGNINIQKYYSIACWGKLCYIYRTSINWNNNSQRAKRKPKMLKKQFASSFQKINTSHCSLLIQFVSDSLQPVMNNWENSVYITYYITLSKHYLSAYHA